MSEDWFVTFLEDKEFQDNLSRLGEFEYYDEDLDELIVFKYWTDTRWRITEIGNRKYILSPSFWNDGTLEARFALVCNPELNLRIYVKTDNTEDVFGKIGCFKILVDYTPEMEQVGVERIELSPKDEILATIQNLDYFFTEKAPIYMSFDYNIIYQALNQIIDKGFASSELLEHRCNEIKELLLELMSDDKDDTEINPQIYIQIKALLDFDPKLWVADIIDSPFIVKLIDYLEKMFEIEAPPVEDEEREELGEIQEKINKTLYEIREYINKNINKNIYELPEDFKKKLLHNIEDLLLELMSYDLEDIETNPQIYNKIKVLLDFNPKLWVYDVLNGSFFFKVIKFINKLHKIEIPYKEYEDYYDYEIVKEKCDEKIEEISSEIGGYIYRNIKKLPKDVLLKLAEEEYGSKSIWVMGQNFYLLSEDIRNKLLSKLPEKDYFKATLLLNYFDNLPKDIRNKLLFQTAEDCHECRNVAKIVYNQFNKLSEDVRNRLLLKCAEKDYASEYVAKFVMWKSDKLSIDVRNELLHLLNHHFAGIKHVVGIVAENYNKLPEDVKNQLLQKLEVSDYYSWHCKEDISTNFDKLPEDIKEKLILKLARDKSAAKEAKDKMLLKSAQIKAVAEDVRELFDKHPENLDNLLFELAEDDSTAEGIAEYISKYFSKVAKDIREKILYMLAEKESVAEQIALIVIEHFSSLPENLSNVLLGRDYIAYYVARTIYSNFNRIPENVRNSLLLKVADNWCVLKIITLDNISYKLPKSDEITELVIYTIRAYFDNFPENVRNSLLLKVAGVLSISGVIVDTVRAYFDNFSERVRNNLLLKCAEDIDADMDVAIAVVEYFDKLPEGVRNRLLLKFAEAENFATRTEEHVVRAVMEYFNKIPEDVRNRILLKLTDWGFGERTGGHIEVIIKENFNKLPKSIRDKLLLRLKEIEKWD